MTCNKCTELQAENLQMREALEKIYNPTAGDPDDFWIAKDCLNSAPHTKKLADRIKALEALVKSARNHFCLSNKTGEKIKICIICRELSTLDALVKE